ncbi:MAG TPA: PhoX family phosphatase [Methyloceanibacter sp.]|nr:PhoX family phosphatase [Methyloceanibacter sp.]
MTPKDSYRNRAAACEAADDVPLSPANGETIGDVILRRYSRRAVMRGTLGVTAAAVLFGPGALPKAEAATATEAFDFPEVEAGIDTTHHVAEGYRAKPLLSWGDPLMPNLPDFDPEAQSPEDQAKRFGYNNDYIAHFPIDGSSTHGLLCINHEYTNEELMFPSLSKRQDTSGFEQMTETLVEIEMAAHGVTIVEVKKEGEDWQVVRPSPYNRRITPHTPMSADGPAAGDARLKTSYDPSGKALLGTLNNCAGGHTPWGTYLTAEENFRYYFWTDHAIPGGAVPKGLGGKQAASYERYGVPGQWQAWGKFVNRFNVDIEPNEPNRFGWIVEIDPRDPTSVPVKHSALGRFCHEGAETVLSADKHAVVYCGDDSRFEYIYRFVSNDPYVEGDRSHNMTLLSKGTLSAAKFKDDGTGEWLPLKFGEGKLTEDGSYGKLKNEADVLIDARIAAELVEATKMDRPEDVQPTPDGRVYAMLTNNTKREQTDKANPRADNAFGHIIEMTPQDGDHAASAFTWRMLVRCGDPAKDDDSLWGPDTTANGWFVCPDNAAVDDRGRLWVATDQGDDWGRTGRADGLFALETDGDRSGTSKLFFRVPVGAEMCGPCFTPNGETLFVSVQHPGADGAEAFPDFGRPSVFKDPVTRWPDPDPNSKMPPRPSVMVITKAGGGKIA